MKLKRYALYFATCVISVFMGPVTVVGQAKVRVVEWPTYPLGRIYSSAEGIKRSPVTEALEIVDIKVESHSITIGHPFAADEDWLKTLTLRIKNISGQPIVGARMGFSLAETRIENKGLGFSLEYGKGLSTGIPSDEQRVIGPNEEFEFRFNDAQYRHHRAFVSERTSLPSFSIVWIGVTSVKFDDGSFWTSGCLRGSNPSNSCTPRAP
jgi:hypothetical protein